MILPINPIYNPDGTYFGLPGSGQNIGAHLIIMYKQWGIMVKYFTRTNQFIGSASVTYKAIQA